MSDDPFDDLQVPEQPKPEPIKTGKPGRPKGLPKTGGRKAGVPNKRNAAIRDLMAALKCDPVTVLARICMNAKNDPELRRRCAADLLPYLHPRLNSVDVTTDGSMQPQIINIISAISRLPGDPPLDITPAVEALPAPAEVSLPATAGTLAPIPDEMHAGRPCHPSSSPMDAPQPALPLSSDRLHDDHLCRERSDDAKIATLNIRAAKFVA